jgi:ubiquitin-protein ligase
VSPRNRRLTSDHEAMRQLAADRPETFGFEATGSPPDRYSVVLAVTGLARGIDGRPVLRAQHRFDAYLHLDYPRQAPLLRWRTPIFHPNILPPNRNGGVGIGAWSPTENLADLCARIADIVALASFSVVDALDHEAAAWVAARNVGMETDLRELVATA